MRAAFFDGDESSFVVAAAGLGFSFTEEELQEASAELRQAELDQLGNAEIDEALQVYLDYVPHYFEDGAPLSITLDGAFSYDPAEKKPLYGYERYCGIDPESERHLSCSILRTSMYIGPDGRVCPCMSMTVQEDDEAFPSLFETPLREILGKTPFMERCACTVAQVRDANPACRTCEWVEKCHGGCRAAAYNDAGDYYAIDPGQCHFFTAGWYNRFTHAAAQLDSIGHEHDGKERI